MRGYVQGSRVPGRSKGPDRSRLRLLKAAEVPEMSESVRRVGAGGAMGRG